MHSSYYPLLLLPVRIETRFVTVNGGDAPGDYLWVRVLPDRIFTDQFASQPTAEEKVAAQQLLTDNDSLLPITLDIWTRLVQDFGVSRSLWILENAPELTKLPAVPEVENKAFLRWLPKQFYLYLYEAGSNQPLEIDGQPGYAFRPIQKSGLPVLPEENDWLTDFDAAVRIGMAAKVPLRGVPTRTFSKVIITGIHDGAPSTAINELLERQHFTDGLTLLDYGTPTNNLKGTQTPYSTFEDFDAQTTYERLVGPRYGPDPAASSQISTTSVAGLDPGQVPPVTSPTHTERLLHALRIDYPYASIMQNGDKRRDLLPQLLRKATWFALGGRALEDLFGEAIDNEAMLRLWRFYSNYVDGQGPLPVLKTDDLPYAILPVINFQQEEIADRDPLETVLWRLSKEWLAIAQNNSTDGVPRLTSDTVDPNAVLPSMLSMRARSGALQIRVLEQIRAEGNLPKRILDQITTPQPPLSYASKIQERLTKDDLAADPEATFSWGLDFVDEAIADMQEKLQLFEEPGNRAPLVSDREAIAYAPILSFRNAASLDVDELELVLTKPDWYLPNRDTGPDDDLVVPIIDSYANWIALLLEQGGSFLYQYTGDTDFLLFHLLEKSISYAAERYSRDIFFHPRLDQIDGVKSHRVKMGITDLAPSKRVNKGDTVMIIEAMDEDDNTFEISIKAPFSGRIETTYVEKGEPLPDDRRLFFLEDAERRDAIMREIAETQGQLILEIERQKQVGIDVVAAQNAAILEILDLNSCRLDAWITALAQRELDRVREAAKSQFPEAAIDTSGILLGAYGWVENLTPQANGVTIDGSRPLQEQKARDTYDLNGGYLHAPSPAQAVAAAMFRNAFSPHQNTAEQANPFTLKLTSDRIQKGLQLLEGVQQDQPLEALLGYRLERFLHDNNRTDLIYPLRRQFPLTINKLLGGREGEGIPTMTVIDGIQFIETGDLSSLVSSNAEKTLLERGQSLLIDLLDGATDILLYEAGYQMTQGNFPSAAAAMDAAKGAGYPPTIESLKTQVPGILQQHTMAWLVPPNEESIRLESNPRAYLEPQLEEWINTIIGLRAKMRWRIRIYDEQEEHFIFDEVVKVSNLQIGYLDLLSMAESTLNDDASELEQRMLDGIAADLINTAPEYKQDFLNRIWPQHWTYSFHRPEEEALEGGNFLGDALEVLRYLRRFIASARPLQPADLGYLPEDDVSLTLPFSVMEQYKKRLEDIHNAIRVKDLPLKTLGRFDVQNAKRLFFNSIEDKERQAKLAKEEALRKVEQSAELLAELTPDRSYDAQVEIVQGAAQILFGKDFKILFPCQAPADFLEKYARDQTLLIGSPGTALPHGLTGGAERARHWLAGRAAVSPEAELFSDNLMLAEQWSWERQDDPFLNPNLVGWHFRIIQHLPEGADYPWVALSESEIKTILKGPGYSGKTLPDLAENHFLPEESQTFVAYAPPGEIVQRAVGLPNALLYGWFVESFSEKIPFSQVQTSVAFQYDGPNTEAPNAWLLATLRANELETTEWTPERLQRMVAHTADLAKIRMVDNDALQHFEYALPMAYLLNIRKSE